MILFPSVNFLCTIIIYGSGMQMDKLIMLCTLKMLFMDLANCGTLKQSLFMDKETGCGTTIRNTGMEEGDLYTVKSDQYSGKTPPNKVNKQPGTCSMVIDFGTRLLDITVQNWRCSRNFTDTYLGIYDTCDISRRKHPMISLTCTSNVTQIRGVKTKGPCVMLYHHRGNTKYGYYFVVDVQAGPELMSFPAGAMATIIVSTMVVVMVLVKIACMVTGYENRLPKLNLTKEEEKKIMEEANMHVRLQQAIVNEADDSRSLLVPQNRENCHRTLGATHSNISGEHSELDYDFLNLPQERHSHSRTKRYPSYKTASIFRH